MKLKLWVEVLLVLIMIASGFLITYDMEISMIPFIIGFIIFVCTSAILSEYGRLFKYIMGKIEELAHK